MNDICSMLKLFGNRYILCDNEQAELDVQINREDMASSYLAILHYAEMLKQQES